MATPITSSRKAHDCLKWAWVDSSFPSSVRCVYEISPSLYQSFERLVCVIGVLCELCEHPPEIFPQSRLLVGLGRSFWHILHLENISDLITTMLRKHSQCQTTLIGKNVYDIGIKLTCGIRLFHFVRGPCHGFLCMSVRHIFLLWIKEIMSLYHVNIFISVSLFRFCISDFQWSSTHSIVAVGKVVCRTFLLQVNSTHCGYIFGRLSC